LASLPDVNAPPRVNARQYASPRSMEQDTFPEHEYVKHKQNVGVAFSGGGSRSFVATVGYLRALLDLGLLEKIRYISSVSGGSWATAAFVFNDDSVPMESFLGKPTKPEDITLKGAKSIPYNSARGFPVRTNLITILVEELLLEKVDPTDVWVSAIHKTFLAPAGIRRDALMAWTREQVAETMSRNPDLLDRLSFVLPCGGRPACHDRPFPIMNTAMLGPVDAAPFGMLARHYVMMQMTPLYIGFPVAQTVHYTSSAPTVPNLEIHLGGLVEPAGFGSLTDAEFCGLQKCSNATTVSIPLAEFPFSLANASAASSWAPGAVVAEQPLLQPLDNVLLSAPYYSPLDGGASRDVFLGDGANMENQGVITLLQRGLPRIVVFVNSQVPMRSRSEYHPYLRLPNAKDIDYSVACLFGVQSIIPPIGEDFTHDQVFHYTDFARVVSAMQRTQAKGRGIVTTVKLKTVHNKWWGIKAGHEVRLTMVYMSRAYEWEAKLQPNVAAQVAPQRGLQLPTALPSNGTFKDFPHPSITNLHLTHSMANMLSDLAWWVVVNNEKVFMREIAGSWFGDDNLGDNDGELGYETVQAVPREGQSEEALLM